MRMFCMFMISCLLTFSLKADEVNLKAYEAQSHRALEMAQYHPDKAKKMHREMALKLEAEIEANSTHDSHLYYNLGNLWYHSGDLGKSLLWYRKAENDYPNSKMLNHNINIVLKERLDALPENFLPSWVPYGDILVKCETYIFLVFYVSFAYFLWGIGSYAKKNLLKQQLKSRAVFFVAASVVWLGFIWLGSQKSDGVILDVEIIARKGNGLIFAPAFTHPLHEGTEVIKLEERSDWVYVQLSNGQRCWLPGQSLGWIH